MAPNTWILWHDHLESGVAHKRHVSGGNVMSNPPAQPVTEWKLQQGVLGRFSILYSCPNCGSDLTSPSNDAGRADTCPDCSCVFILPQEAATQLESIQKKREEAKVREQKAREQNKEEEQRRRRALQQAEYEAQLQRTKHQEAILAADAAARAAKRKEHLKAIGADQKKYRVILVDSAEAAEDVCNNMGFQGWDLDQSFTDTFNYQQCCGTESKRQFVLIFSQRLSVEGPL